MVYSIPFYTLSPFNAIQQSLHDSMNASTLDDERRDIANLVSVFLSKVAFGRDFERMLEFFMNARSAFR